MANPKIILSSTLINSPLVDPATGRLSYAGLKYFQSLEIAGGAFTPTGTLAAPISPTAPIAVRSIPIGTLLQHITDTGLLDSTDSILVDGTGHPLAGGKAAYTALVTSGPAAGQVLEWNGAAWVPVTLTTGVTSLDTITGAVALVAGSGVTITDNSPIPGKITIAAAGGGSGYVKGSVTLGPQGGAGTYTATATVTGAVAGNAALVGFVNSAEFADVSNVGIWVSAANTVTVQYTTPGAILAFVVPVVVFN
jgi:hypothetical protein